MTPEEIVEAMAESAHNAWWTAYLDMGITSRKAEWGEEFMVPYDELTERGKDLDRVIMRAILEKFTVMGLILVDTNLL